MSHRPRFASASVRLGVAIAWWTFALVVRVVQTLLAAPTPPTPPIAAAQFALKATLAVIVPALFLRWALPDEPLPFVLGVTPGDRPRHWGKALLLTTGYLALLLVLMRMQGETVGAWPGVAALGWTLLHVTVEELGLRGAVLGWLARDRPFWRANLFTSLLFVSMHWPSWLASGLRVEAVIMSVPLFVLSLVLGSVTRLTGTIWLAVALHLVNNLVSG